MILKKINDVQNNTESLTMFAFEELKKNKVNYYNYLAIDFLELLGNIHPTEEHISLVEILLREQPALSSFIEKKAMSIS